MSSPSQNSTAETTRISNYQRLLLKKQQVRSLPKSKKLDKLAVYSSCKVWTTLVFNFILLTFVYIILVDVIVHLYRDLSNEKYKIGLCSYKVNIVLLQTNSWKYFKAGRNAEVLQLNDNAYAN